MNSRFPRGRISGFSAAAADCSGAYELLRRTVALAYAGGEDETAKIPAGAALADPDAIDGAPALGAEVGSRHRVLQCR